MSAAVQSGSYCFPKAGMFSLRQLLLLFAVLWALHCSTLDACPPREQLYPCYCTSVPLTKRHSFTVVTCSFVQKASSLQRIYRVVRSMVIDRLIILDSFWEAGDQESVLPENWLSLLKIKDLEIIDSKMSPNFTCDISAGCPNTFLKKLTVRNSTSSGTINSLCVKGNMRLYWTSCLTSVQQLSYSHNKLTIFDKTAFPNIMPELLILNLSYNKINTIGGSAFVNLPKLDSLDLSNNVIKALDQGIFGKQTNVLTYLDLSWNTLTNLSSDIFEFTPHLVSFLARGNHLDVLPEEHWKALAKTIKLIDLQDNFLRCDCHMVWINCTLRVRTNILGSCANGYENTPLMRVSKYMSERCTEDGILQLRDNKTKGNACRDWWNRTRSYNDNENYLNAVQLVQLTPALSRSTEKSRRRNRN